MIPKSTRLTTTKISGWPLSDEMVLSDDLLLSNAAHAQKFINTYDYDKISRTYRQADSDRLHFTNTGHIAMYDCIKDFLEKTGCRDKEVMKIEDRLRASDRSD